MADNAGDSGGEWMLIMTDADRKRAKKTPPDTDSRRRNKLTLTGAPSVTTNTSLHGNPSSQSLGGIYNVTGISSYGFF